MGPPRGSISRRDWAARGSKILGDSTQHRLRKGHGNRQTPSGMNARTAMLAKYAWPGDSARPEYAAEWLLATPQHLAN